MTPLAIFLILISTLGHASWNLLSKRQNPSQAYFFVANLATIGLVLPLLVYFSPSITQLPASFWLLVGATGFFQSIYFVSLAGAYQHGDISLAYPILRALPVVMVPGISFLLGRGEQITSISLAGMFLILIGCLIMPMKHFKDIRPENYINPWSALALAAALGTCGYTLVDDTALRQLRANPALGLDPFEATLLFASLQATSIGAGLGLYTLFKHSERANLRRFWHEPRLAAQAGLAGVVMMVTYGLVLASMAFVSDVSYVSAFRQLSIPIGAGLGIVVQKEPFYYPKLAGILIVSAGLAIVALG